MSARALGTALLAGLLLVNACDGDTSSKGRPQGDASTADGSTEQEAGADASVPPDASPDASGDASPDASGDASPEAGGDACAPNACGGCATLAGSEGDHCGTCGELSCASDGESLECVELSPTNACGGCTALTGAVDDACGVCGKLACDGTDGLKCDDPGRNACGGCAALAGAPGDSCGTCGGELACDGTDALKCNGASPTNACNGCRTLANPPGKVCGACGSGTYVCSGTEATTCSDPVTTPAPGTSCGTCSTSSYACSPGNQTTFCQKPNDTNVCGGCGAIPPTAGTPGAPCGACGTLTCSADKNSVVCTDPGLNSCGGCATLKAEPGTACGSGTCGVTVCSGTERVTCAPPKYPVGAQCGLCGTSSYACASPGQTTCQLPDDRTTVLDLDYEMAKGPFTDTIRPGFPHAVAYVTQHTGEIISATFTLESTRGRSGEPGELKISLYAGVPGGGKLLGSASLKETDYPGAARKVEIRFPAPLPSVDKSTPLYFLFESTSTKYVFRIHGDLAGKGPDSHWIYSAAAGWQKPLDSPWAVVQMKGCY